MTIYQRMLLHAGILRAPEDGTGGGASGGASDGASGDGGQQQQQQQQQQQPPDWFTKVTADPDMKAWAESKGWKDAATADPYAIAQSYRNLETLFGADKAGRTVLLPKDADDKAALDVIYDKLGRPKDAGGYEIALPDGADTAFADTARAQFHKLNLTTEQGKGMAEWYRAMELDAVAARDKRNADEVEGLQKEWGAEFDRKTEVGKAAVKAAGLSDEYVKMLEQISPANAAKMFEFFGRNYVDGNPPGNEQRTSPNFSAMNPAQAAAKIDELYADQAFMSRYSSSDPKVRAGAIEQMNSLSELANNARAR